jgi:hypothetical protein
MQARIIAEAQFDVFRIRAIRAKIINSAAESSSDARDPVAEAHAIAVFPTSPMRALLRALPQLETLECYERRALSRRRQAVRQMYKSSM